MNNGWTGNYQGMARSTCSVKAEIQTARLQDGQFAFLIKGLFYSSPFGNLIDFKTLIVVILKSHRIGGFG